MLKFVIKNSLTAKLGLDDLIDSYCLEQLALCRSAKHLEIERYSGPAYIIFYSVPPKYPFRDQKIDRIRFELRTNSAFIGHWDHSSCLIALAFKK